MVKKDKKLRINYRILSILILIVLSFSIMYFSINNSNIEIKYQFKDKVEFVNISKSYNYYQTRIGEVEIYNSGFLPSKIYLKNLIGCIDDSTYGIFYSFSTKNYGDLFSKSNNHFFTEVSTNEKKILIMKISNNNYKIPNIEKEKKSQNLISKTLFIYEDKTNTEFYKPSFCDNFKEEDVIKIIQIIK